MQKKVGLAAVLVLLCGVSAYMWSTRSGTETDQQIAAITETWNCAECGKQFELSVAEARVMYQAPRRDPELSPIVCPYCDAAGAERDGTLVSMGGGVPTGGGDSGDEEPEEEEEDRPPEVRGTMGPIDRP